MNAKDFENEISRRLTESERFADAAAMVDIVAKARARGGEPSREDYQFSLNVLCFLWDPVKNEGYERQAHELRRAYTGISQSSELPIAFEKSLGPRLIEARSVREALQLSFDEIFVREFVYR